MLSMSMPHQMFMRGLADLRCSTSRTVPWSRRPERLGLYGTCW